MNSHWRQAAWRAVYAAKSIRSSRAPGSLRSFSASCRLPQQAGPTLEDVHPEKPRRGRPKKGQHSGEAVAKPGSTGGIRYEPPDSAPPIRFCHDISPAGHPPVRSVRSDRPSPHLNRDKPSPVQHAEGYLHLHVDGKDHRISAKLLRDMCECPQCVDPSTKQKLFATTDVPTSLRVDNDRYSPPSGDETEYEIKWLDDVDGFGPDHSTVVSRETIERIVRTGTPIEMPKMPEKVLWDDVGFRQDVVDLDYEAYMSDDSVLHQALQNLHTHGLVFLTNVPESEGSVASIAERIGPVKNTFYGYTWDVRSVPQAKNVAYTSQNLGFHMDLLYMKQPPHLQFLHCIRASSAGGASTFTDSYKAASDLFQQENGHHAFRALSETPVNYHYNHPESHYYFQSRPVMELKEPLYFAGRGFNNLRRFLSYAEEVYGVSLKDIDIFRWIEAVAWSPPFQAPFSYIAPGRDPSGVPSRNRFSELHTMNGKMDDHWHPAAKRFDDLIHRPEGIYERMMKPGECVLFDNRRVLHARKAFEVGDIGKERWLRGAYLDKDPYMSKMRVLWERFGRPKPADD